MGGEDDSSPALQIFQLAVFHHALHAGYVAIPIINDTLLVWNVAVCFAVFIEESIDYLSSYSHG